MPYPADFTPYPDTPAQSPTAAQRRVLVQIARGEFPRGAAQVTIDALLDRGLIAPDGPIDFALSRAGADAVAPWHEYLSTYAADQYGGNR